MSAVESMPGSAGYEVTFETIPAGLRARVVGIGSFETTVASWREIVVQVRKQAPAALLLIDELRGKPLTESQWRDLVDAMRGQGLERTRIAHVKSHGRNSIEFCELFAREIGIDARVFTDEQTALLWLEYESREPGYIGGKRDYGQLSISRDLEVPGVLRVRINGRSGDAVSVLRVWQDVIESVHGSRVLRLMAILDTQGEMLSEQELAAVVARLAGLAPPGLRVALVETRDSRQHYDERASLLALDRGFSVNVFSDEASALLWLRYGAT